MALKEQMDHFDHQRKGINSAMTKPHVGLAQKSTGLADKVKATKKAIKAVADLPKRKYKKQLKCIRRRKGMDDLRIY